MKSITTEKHNKHKKCVLKIKKIHAFLYEQLNSYLINKYFIP